MFFNNYRPCFQLAHKTELIELIKSAQNGEKKNKIKNTIRNKCISFTSCIFPLRWIGISTRQIQFLYSLTSALTEKEVRVDQFGHHVTISCHIKEVILESPQEPTRTQARWIHDHLIRRPKTWATVAPGDRAPLYFWYMAVKHCGGLKYKTYTHFRWRK